MYALLQAAVVGVEVKARNPILPEGKEILWAAVGFIIIFAVLAKLAFPAIKKALKAREDHIRADLEAAEASRTEAEQALEGYRLQLAEARTEAGRIIEEARQAADQVRQDLMRKAEDDARSPVSRRATTSSSRPSGRQPISRTASPSCRSSWPRKWWSATSTARRSTR